MSSGETCCVECERAAERVYKPEDHSKEKNMKEAYGEKKS